jgi:hypothetical protein
MLPRELAQAFAFGAEDKRKRSRQRRILESLACLLGEPHPQIASLAQLRETLREVLDEDHRHDVERSARGFGEHAGERRAVPLGQDEAACAESRRRAQCGADILRVGDLIEHEQNTVGLHLVEPEWRQWLSLEGNTLMHGVRSEHPVEISWARLLWRHAALGEERGEPVRRVLGGDKLANLPSRIGESRLHGMKSIKQNPCVIGRAPGPLSLRLAPVMALRPIRPWSVAPHGPVVSFAG